MIATIDLTETFEEIAEATAEAQARHDDAIEFARRTLVELMLVQPSDIEEQPTLLDRGMDLSANGQLWFRTRVLQEAQVLRIVGEWQPQPWRAAN